MITRAYKKNMVIVSDIDSDTVEQAYLFLKDNTPEPTESALLKEADRLVRLCGAEKKRRINIPSALIWFFSGALISALTALVLTLVI
ncbi:MAG: hypothetical protein IJR55_05435 [Clostridia bacterium]|nr:hypothetical protein [Clostridia bacterium]